MQRDRGAKAFLSTLAGKRAISALAQGEASVARRDAEQSLLLWHEAGDARYVLAVLLAADHRYAESRAQLDTLLSFYPFDASARAFRDSVVAHDPAR